MAGGFEPAHWPLPLPGWLMGEFGTVVQALVRAVLDAWHQLLASGFIAFEFVGDDHPRRIAQSLEELAKETLGGARVAARLNPNIQHATVLIHSSPEIVTSPVDAEIDLVQMPRIAAPGRPAAQFVGDVLAEFQTPLADRLVGDDEAANGQQFLHIAIAQREAKIQLHRVVDDLGGVAVTRKGFLVSFMARTYRFR